MITSAASLEGVGLKHRINQYLGSKSDGILHKVGLGALILQICRVDGKTLDSVSKLGD